MDTVYSGNEPEEKLDITPQMIQAGIEAYVDWISVGEDAPYSSDLDRVVSSIYRAMKAGSLPDTRNP